VIRSYVKTEKKGGGEGDEKDEKKNNVAESLKRLNTVKFGLNVPHYKVLRTDP